MTLTIAALERHDSARLLMSTVALGFASSFLGCHSQKSSAPQNAAESTMATASMTAPSASAASSFAVDAAPAVSTDSGPALSDAANAGSRAWRVLVPKSVPDDPPSGDPRDAIAHAVAREVTAARADHAAPSLVVLYADTTVDYGCLCPPFVYAPFWNSGRDDGTFLPVFAAGVPNPPLAKEGLYRFLGHFDGRRITGYDWLKMRGQKIEEGMDDYANTSPVFVVDGWCFEPNESYSSPTLEKVYKTTLVSMQKDGRFCPGARLPAHAVDVP